MWCWDLHPGFLRAQPAPSPWNRLPGPDEPVFQYRLRGNYTVSKSQLSKAQRKSSAQTQHTVSQPQTCFQPLLF